jgi:hypothetical protein
MLDDKMACSSNILRNPKINCSRRDFIHLKTEVQVALKQSVSQSVSSPVFASGPFLPQLIHHILLIGESGQYSHSCYGAFSLRKEQDCLVSKVLVLPSKYFKYIHVERNNHLNYRLQRNRPCTVDDTRILSYFVLPIVAVWMV